MNDNFGLKQALQQIQLFQHMDSDEFDMLITYCPLSSFQSGELLLKQGQKSPGIYIVLTGDVVVTARVLGQSAIKLAVLEAGNFVGEISTIEKGPCTATVAAGENLQCLLVSTSYFDLLATRVPRMHYKIMKGIAEMVCVRLQETFSQIKTIMKNSPIIPRLAFVEVIKKSFQRPRRIKRLEGVLDLEQLKNNPLFEYFSKSEHRELLSYAELIDAPKRCLLIKEGEKDAPCYIVLRGAVEINISEGVKSAKLAVLGPGSLISSISYIDDSPSTVSYMACERAILLKIDFKKLMQLQKNNILLWYKIYNEISKAMVGLEGYSYKFYNRLNSEHYNRQ